MKQKVMDPKKYATQKVESLKKDVYAIMWIALIIALIAMTFFAKAYIRDMLVISILFLIFWFLEPFLFGATGKTVTAFLSRGRKVPRWKRFPLFFLVIVMLYVLYSGIQAVMTYAFPAGSVNVVIVALWLGFLFLIWNYKVVGE